MKNNTSKLSERLSKKRKLTFILFSTVILLAVSYILFIPTSAYVNCKDDMPVDGLLYCEIRNTKYRQLIAICEITSGMGPGGPERFVSIKDNSYPVWKINKILDDNCSL